LKKIICVGNDISSSGITKIDPAQPGIDNTPPECPTGDFIFLKVILNVEIYAKVQVDI
jgi:hypothetical protein